MDPEHGLLLAGRPFPFFDGDDFFVKTETLNFAAEGQAVEVKLLRALVMGSRQSDEIQLLLDSQALGKADYQGLALTLTDHSVNEPRARATFEGLKRHQMRLQASLGR